MKYPRIPMRIWVSICLEFCPLGGCLPFSHPMVLWTVSHSATPAPGIRCGPRLRPGQFQYPTPVHSDWSKRRVQNPSRVSLLPWCLTIWSLERTSSGSSSSIMDRKDEGNLGLLAAMSPPCSQQPHFKLPKPINSFCLNWIKSVFCQLQRTDP